MSFSSSHKDFDVTRDDHRFFHFIFSTTLRHQSVSLVHSFFVQAIEEHADFFNFS